MYFKNFYLKKFVRSSQQTSSFFASFLIFSLGCIMHNLWWANILDLLNLGSPITEKTFLSANQKKGRKFST